MADIVIIGSGQIAKALKKIIKQAVLIDRSVLDLENISAIQKEIGKYCPKIVINAAAYTAVDRAENEKDLSILINGFAPAEMAKYCKENNAIFIHYSTDYVFNGQKEGVWSEDDKTDPVNQYGLSKLEGEEKIKNIGGRYLIFRTSWVYDEYGNNFLNKMIELSDRESLQVVNDQAGSPSYAYDIAKATSDIVVKLSDLRFFPAGIYHMTNSGYTTWYLFAKEILKNKKIDIIPVSSDKFKTIAKRPFNSKLSLNKLYDIFKIQMPNWQDGLDRCLKSKYRKENENITN